jgi:hypothetical protein
MAEASQLRAWADEKRRAGLLVEARELERMAVTDDHVEVLPRGSVIRCRCPRVVDRRPLAGNESITIWHGPECEGRGLPRPQLAAEAWTGELVDGGGPDPVRLWRCGHEHADRGEAWRCAVAELNRRAQRRRAAVRSGR